MRVLHTSLLCIVLLMAVQCVPGQPGATQSGTEATPLPAPATEGTMALELCIAQRRSVRSFTDQALTWEQIGQLLWAAQGITELQRGLRAAPSAGALYPLELYVVTPEGIYHYLPAEHAVAPLAQGDRRAALGEACLGQLWVAQAPVSFVITAVYARTAAKYGERARRYADMEAGGAMENLLLQAVALGLGGVAVGAFRDPAVSEIIGIDATETPLLVVPVGYPRGG